MGDARAAQSARRLSLLLMLIGAGLLALALTLGLWPGCARGGGARRKMREQPTAHRRLATGACNAAADLNKIRAGGQSRFEADMESFGLACVGRGPCVTGRFETDRGYSPGCAACHGELSQCTRNQCFSQCILGRTPACAQCATDKCNPAFGQCVGDAAAKIVLPAPRPWMLPSPPPVPMPPPAPPAPPTSPPNVSPRAPEVAPREIINILETNVADVGEWGGTCTCPNGNVYNVGDNNDGCGSLACIGGIPGVCGQNNPGGAYRRVTCGVGPPFPPPSPPPPPLPPPLPPPSPPTPDNCPVCMECDNANNLQDEVQEESCPDGLGGSSCQMCTSTVGCAALYGGQTFGELAAGICTPGLLPWHSGDLQRGYDCAIQGLGSLSASCVIPQGEWRGGNAIGSCGQVTLYAPEANLHLKCAAENCAFQAGSYEIVCTTFSCLTDDGKDPATALDLDLGGEARISCEPPDDSDEGPSCGEPAPTQCSFTVERLGATLPATCSQSRCAQEDTPLTCDAQVQVCAEGQREASVIVAASGFGLLSLAVALLLWGTHGTPVTERSSSKPGALRRLTQCLRCCGLRDTANLTAHATATSKTCQTGTTASGSRSSHTQEGLILAGEAISPNIEAGSTVASCAAASAEEGRMGTVATAAASTVGSHQTKCVGAPNKPNERSVGKVAAGYPPLHQLLDAVRPLPSPPPVLEFCVAVVPESSSGWESAAVSRHILAPVSERLHPGRTHGIFGPSGSGKSTLLSALAGDPSDGLRVDGRVTLGGVDAAALPRGTIGYCAQDDVLTACLTAFEAVLFAATLRLPRNVTVAQREELSYAILDALGLEKVKHKRIGGRTAGAAGLSGGERRRVSLAILLASAPAVLLVDEPTSGLDASSALLVAALLRDVCATTGRSAVLSVHQPSSRLFATIDRVLLLARGRLLFSGQRAALLPHLLAHELPPPAEDISISDHMLELTFTHGEEMAAAAVTAAFGTPRAEAFADGFVQAGDGYQGSGDQSGVAFLSSRRTSTYRVATELLWRCSAQLARDSTMLKMQLGVAAVMAAAMGVAFLGVDGSAAGFQNKAGAMQITLTLFAFGGLSMLPVVASEWAIVWREWHAGFYSAWLYALIKLSLDLIILRVLPSILFGAVFYALVGLRSELPSFLLFQLTLVLANCVSGLYCSAIGAALPHAAGAACLLGVVLMLVSTTLSGLNLNHETLPSALRWLPRTSFCSYAFEILLTTELKGTTVLVEIPGAPAVRLHSRVMLDLFGLHIENVTADLLALTMFVVGAFGINVAILAIKLDRTIPKLRRRICNCCARNTPIELSGTLKNGTLNQTIKL